MARLGRAEGDVFPLCLGGNRADLVVATKVGGSLPGQDNLKADTILRAAEDSLEGLGTDVIDLSYAHFDDEDTPLEESLRAFDELVRRGGVRRLGISNYSPERLEAALELQRREGLAELTVLQPLYSLVERDFERSYLPLAGKYRRGGEEIDSPRAAAARAYLDDGGDAVLEAPEEVDRLSAATRAPA